MLTPRKRIRKKDLKEDKLVTFYFKSRAWIDDHLKEITIGLLAVVVIIAGIGIYTYLHGKAEKTASVEFSKAVRTFQAMDYRNAAKEFGVLTSKYGSTRSGKLARFYLAQSHYQNGEYEQAAKQFRKAAGALSGDKQLKAAALAGEAAALEQLGKYAEAAKKFQAVAEKYKDIPKAPSYLLRAARCWQLAGNSQKASALYQRIITDYPDSREKEDAVLLSALKW
ncbi:MAG: tetratricopeptide repeat protein [candidate division KSB1 bacterium]|nr:tetratricopeptide repeat protein [candidate division KSB1 bacterium]